MDRREKIYVHIIIFVMLILCVEIIFLAFQNRQLNKTIIEKRRMTSIGISVGDKISSLKEFFEGNDILNRSINAKQKMLLIFFSKNCSACILDVPIWNNLCSKYKSNVRIIGISLSSEEDTDFFIHKYNLEFEVFIDEIGRAHV